MDETRISRLTPSFIMSAVNTRVSFKEMFQNQAYYSPSGKITLSSVMTSHNFPFFALAPSSPAPEPVLVPVPVLPRPCASVAARLVLFLPFCGGGTTICASWTEISGVWSVWRSGSPKDQLGLYA
jgi:hypothetical protein